MTPSRIFYKQRTLSPKSFFVNVNNAKSLIVLKILIVIIEHNDFVSLQLLIETVVVIDTNSSMILSEIEAASRSLFRHPRVSPAMQKSPQDEKFRL